MQRLRLNELINAYQHVSSFQQALVARRQHNPDEYSFPFNESDISELRDSVATIEKILEVNGLNVALTSARKLQAAFSNGSLQTTIVFYELVDIEKISLYAKETLSRLPDEFELRQVLLMQSDDVRYFDTNPLFGGEVTLKFPSVGYEIEEAGKCLALERSTAAAFHSTTEEARHIFEIVGGFMRKLASRMDENGLPLA